MTNKEYDYIVIGAGISGLSSAHHLTLDGHRVLVLEATDGTNGASFASTAEMNHDPDTIWETVVAHFGTEGATKLWQLCSNGIDLMSEFAHQLGEKHFRTDRMPAFLYTLREGDVHLLKEKYDFYSSIGAHVSFETEHLPHPLFKALLVVHGEGVTNNQHLMKSLAHAAKEQGADIVHNQKVQNIEGNVVTTTTGESWTGTKIIIATGDGGGLLPSTVAIEHKRTFVVSYERENLPELFRSCIMWDTDEPYHYTRSFDNTRVWVGGEDVEDATYTPSEKADEKKYAEIDAYAHKNFGIDESYKRQAAWNAAFYPATRGLPYIGEVADTSTIASVGFGGSGIITSFLSGYLIAAWERGEALEYKKLFATDW